MCAHMRAVPIEARGGKPQAGVPGKLLRHSQVLRDPSTRRGILEARGLEASLDNMVRLWLQGGVRGKDQKVRLLWAQVLFSTRLWLVTVGTLTGHLSADTSAQRVLRLVTPFLRNAIPKGIQ